MKEDKTKLVATYERSMEDAFLSFDVSNYQESFEEEMIKSYKKGVLPFYIENQNGKTRYVYTITQKLAFHEYIKTHNLDLWLIKEVLIQIIDTLKEARDYLLCEDNFILDPEYFYVDDGGNTIWLCYYMGYQRPVREQMVNLFEVWMKKIDYADQKTVCFVYELYQICRNENCTYEQIMQRIQQEGELHHRGNEEEDRKSLIVEYAKEIEKDEEIDDSGQDMIALDEELCDEEEELFYPLHGFIIIAAAMVLEVVLTIVGLRSSIVRDHYGQIDSMKVLGMILIELVLLALLAKKLFSKEQRCSRMKQKISYIPYQKKCTNHSMQQKESFSYDKDKATGLQEELEREEGTRLLYEEPKTQLLGATKGLKLISKDGDIIDIFQGTHILGSDRSHANIVLEHPTISRIHAQIYEIQGQFFIKDMGSTNGTFLNEERIGQMQSNEIHNEDILRFAEYSYEVVINED